MLRNTNLSNRLIIKTINFVQVALIRSLRKRQNVFTTKVSIQS